MGWYYTVCHFLLFDSYEDWLNFSRAPAGTPAPNHAFVKVADDTFFLVSMSWVWFLG